MSVDYLRIKKYIKDNIPNSFLDGSIISVNYLEGPCPEKEINWQPWRNDGELLPISYLFYSSVINSTEVARKIKVPKGYT